MKIVLVGFMGSGKTSVAEIVASDFKLKLIELDQKILAKTEYTSIAELFKAEGEQAFRKIESELLEETLDEEDDFVLSTGGGILANNYNLLLLKEADLNVFYLKTSFNNIKIRLADDKSRPLFLDLNRAQSLYQERQDRYQEVADYTIDTDIYSIQQVATEIKSILCQ